VSCSFGDSEEAPWGAAYRTLRVCRDAGARGPEGLYSLPGLPDSSAYSCDLGSPFKNKNDVLNESLTFRRERA